MANPVAGLLCALAERVVGSDSLTRCVWLQAGLSADGIGDFGQVPLCAVGESCDVAQGVGDGFYLTTRAVGWIAGSCGVGMSRDVVTCPARLWSGPSVRPDCRDDDYSNMT